MHGNEKKHPLRDRSRALHSSAAPGIASNSDPPESRGAKPFLHARASRPPATHPHMHSDRWLATWHPHGRPRPTAARTGAAEAHSAPAHRAAHPADVEMCCAGLADEHGPARDDPPHARTGNGHACASPHDRERCQHGPPRACMNHRPGTTAIRCMQQAAHSTEHTARVERTGHDGELKELVALLGLRKGGRALRGCRRTLPVFVCCDLHRRSGRACLRVHLHLLHERRVLWKAAEPGLQPPPAAG